MTRAGSIWMRCAVLAAALIACLPALGSAQSPATSVSVTYTFLRDAEWSQTFASGATAAVAHPICRWLQVAASLSISTTREDYSAVGGAVFDFRYESIHAGPRVSRPTGAVRPYGELLAGATRWWIRERYVPPLRTDAVTYFSLAPGAGVDVFFSRRAALRFGADVVILVKHDNRFDRSYRSNLYRVHAGISLHFARR